MKLCVLIIVSGLMCWGTCKMADFLLDTYDGSLMLVLGILLFTVLAIVSGMACVGLSVYGIYFLAAAFMRV